MYKTGADRPRRAAGCCPGAGAATAAVVSAVLVLLRDRLSGRIDADLLVGLLGIAVVLTGLLRILGGFAAEDRLGRRWTLGAIVLGTLEVVLGAMLLLASGRPRPAGYGRSRLGCGQRRAAAGRGAAAAPLRPQLAGTGRVAPGSVARPLYRPAGG